MFLLPRPAFSAFVVIIVALAAFEWGRLCAFSQRWAVAYAGAVALCAALAFLGAHRQAIFVMAAIFWIAVAPAWLWRGVAAHDRRALAIAGFAVLLSAGLAMGTLRPLEMLLVLVLVWVADSAAYFVGRKWGRRKLAPSISPGKTWEGAAGGVAGALAYAIICGTLAEGIIWVPYLAAAALIAVLSIVGDLFESAAKRQAGAKDSGTLLPGHGGILDRIDSATAALPVAALLLPFARSAA
jgi:phosphatidate cytidylyltransferase